MQLTKAYLETSPAHDVSALPAEPEHALILHWSWAFPVPSLFLTSLAGPQHLSFMGSVLQGSAVTPAWLWPSLLCTGQCCNVSIYTCIVRYLVGPHVSEAPDATKRNFVTPVSILPASGVSFLFLSVNPLQKDQKLGLVLVCYCIAT